MTRLSKITVALAISAITYNVNAFAPSSHGVPMSSTALGMKASSVYSTIDSLTKDNFSESLSTIEPFLLEEAGCAVYKKSIRRITSKANAIGVEVPEAFAKEAKATSKRRAKQNEFIQMKEAERLEAEAAAAAETEDAESTEAVEEPVAA